MPTVSPGPQEGETPDGAGRDVTPARRLAAPPTAVYPHTAERPEPDIGQKLGFLCMLVGLFMAILDIQIVVTSLKEIQAGLAASDDEIGWVQTSYLIGEIIMIPLAGYLSRLLSTRVVFAFSAAGFTAMSVACACATSLGEMVVFRALQGFLGGAMIPTVFATGYLLFPSSRQASVTVLIGLIATLAPTLGPTLGGYVTQALSWRWLFLINVVPGLVIAAGVWCLITIDRPDWSLAKGFDYVGLLLLAVFLGSAQYVLDEGPRQDWFGDTTVRYLAMIGVISALLWLWRMLTYRQPIVELRAFLDRNFTLGCLFSFVLGIGLYGGDYLITLYLARVRGLNSLQIGEIMFVMGLFEVLGAPLAWWLAKRLDPRLMLASGYILFSIGTYMMTGMTADWGFQELFWPQAIRGFSLMLCFLPVTTLALGTLSSDQLKGASSLYSLMRNLGGAVGLAVIGTLLNDRLALHWTRFAERITVADPRVQDHLEAGATAFETVMPGDAMAISLRTFATLVQHQATVMSFNDCLLMMSGLFASALLLLAFMRRPNKRTKPEPD